jgi:hypothetical protein
VAAGGTLFSTPVSDIQDGVTVSGTSITGTLKYLDSGDIADYWGAGNFMALKLNSDDWSQYTSVLVGMDPSASSGLVEIVDDDTHDGVFKVSSTTQKFKVVATNGTETKTVVYDLSGLTLESA